ncbi:MAG: type II toxin-antitoxin system VapC family toxin [Methylococcales bacterium]|nr:type II toxin-antitoxin system VapC family toxin [Methylococcales bacterium]
MKLLLDTHIFLWMNGDTSKLSEHFKMLSKSGEHDFYLSVASAWEMQIKHQLGKLLLELPIEELVNKNQLESDLQLLSIELPHISYLEQLPRHHNDPFDRIIIAQAIIEGMTIVTVDHAFADYSVQVVW